MAPKAICATTNEHVDVHHVGHPPEVGVSSGAKVHDLDLVVPRFIHVPCVAYTMW